MGIGGKATGRVKPPDIGSSQDMDSLLFTADIEYEESGAENKFSGITSLYLKEMQS